MDALSIAIAGEGAVMFSLRLFAGMLCAMVGAMTAPAADFSARLTSLLIDSADSRQQRGVTDLSRLRLNLEDQIGPFNWRISYDNELLWGAAVRDPAFAMKAAQPAPTYLDASATLRHTAAVYWRHTLYRGWLRYHGGAFAATLGRQRVAWGSGRIWNPTDRFNPVPPTALEPEQKLGVDVLDVQWRYSATGSLEGVVAPGRAASRTARKSALRWQDTFGELDLALMAARIGTERAVGLDITGNIGDAGARLEWMFADGGGGAPGSSLGRYGQLAVGMDGMLRNQWVPEGLYLAVEYFYNSAAGAAGGSAQDRLQSSSRQLLGVLAGYDLTPLWRVDWLSIFDLERYGWLIAPGLTWSAMEDLEIRLIVQWPGGAAASEFGRFHPLHALRVDWYF